MNTLKRKLTAILLTFAMLFSLMPALPQAAEAVENEQQYVTLSYEETEFTTANSIIVNVTIAGSEEVVQTINVDNAYPYNGQIRVNVADKDYEIASYEFEYNSGIEPSGTLNLNKDVLSISWGTAGNHTLTVDVVLQEASGEASGPATPNGVYQGKLNVEFRFYDSQLVKMIHLKNPNANITPDIKLNSVTVHFNRELASGQYSVEVTDANRETDYLTLNRSNASGAMMPDNVHSIIVKYNDTETITIPANELKFVWNGGTIAGQIYYSVGLNRDDVHVVYFYDQTNSHEGNNYFPVAIEFVNHNETIGDRMPQDPEYPNSNYVFVNWEIDSFDGDGQVFLPTTIVNRDMTVYSQKIGKNAGTQIHIMNREGEFLNRLAELGNVDANEIELNSVKVRIYDTNGKYTNENYVPLPKGWQNDNEYFYVNNRLTAEGGLDEYENIHLQYDELKEIEVWYSTTDGEQKDIRIPIGVNVGELSKALNGDNVDILELRINQEGEVEGQPDDPDIPVVPDKPDADDLEGLIQVAVQCTTDNSHNGGSYRLEDTTFSVSNVDSTDMTAIVTVDGAPYVDIIDKTYGDHSVSNPATQAVEVKYENDTWTLADGSTAPKVLTFYATCNGTTPTPEPSVTSVDKELVEAPIKGFDNADAYTYPENGKVTIPDGGTVTLLYSITVNGNAGTNFTVTDAGAELVKSAGTGTDITYDKENSTFSGTIPDGAESVTFYVSKEFDADALTQGDNGKQFLVNEVTAKVTDSEESGVGDKVKTEAEVEDPSDTKPDAPTVAELNALLDVVLDCASNVGHADETYKDLLENSYDFGDVTHNDEGAYTVGVTIDSDKYIADYSNKVVKVAHEIQDETPATKTVILTYNKDQGNWTTAESPVKFLIVCKGVDWDISNIEKDLVTEATLGAAKTNGVSDDALKNITVPENTNDTVIIPEDGSVTLLYAITVNGKAGIAFSVEDPETTLVKSSANVSVDENADVATYTGSIPDNGTVTFYVSKNFIVDNITENGQLVNSATVAGDDGTTVNPGTEDDPANKDDEVIDGEEEDNRPTPPPYIPGGDDDDNPGDNDGPSGLNTEDHFSYVVGYEDGMVKPQRSITRAEVATIFYRLLEDDVRDDYDTTRNNFSDVTSDSWYNQTVSTLASMGILKGYEDGTFRPNASITRAEFAAIATRFFDETGATYEPGTFTDVTGDEWFAGAIMDAVNLGLIGGYEDGTVRPNNNITRAEACAIVNRTLGRVPDADHLLPADEMTTWPDNPSSAWFYADMQEATNGHEYEWITEDGNKIEEWTDILDKDWNDR